MNYSFLVLNAIKCYERHHDNTLLDDVNRILSSLVGLIEKDVPNNIKNIGQFFWLLSKFAQMVSAQYHLTSYCLIVVNKLARVDNVNAWRLHICTYRFANVMRAQCLQYNFFQRKKVHLLEVNITYREPYNVVNCSK